MKRTDGGLMYDVLRGPDAPPILLSVVSPDGFHWTDEGALTMVGQAFGFRYDERVLTLRVVAARVNVMDGRLELTCR